MKQISKRNWMILAAVAAVVVVAAGAVVWLNFSGRADAEAQVDGFEAELAVAGPLAEMALGQEDAPVTIIEYASLTCPHCGLFHREVMAQVQEEYIDTGQVRWVFREFPLDSFATAGFMLARCAEPRHYFGFIEVMFAQQDEWMQEPNAGLRNIARQGGFNNEEIDACIQDKEVLEGINWIQKRARDEFGVNSTPTFFINGQRVQGALAFEALAPLIDAHIEESTGGDS